MHSEYLINAELLDQSMKSRPYNIYPAPWNKSVLPQLNKINIMRRATPLSFKWTILTAAEMN